LQPEKKKKEKKEKKEKKKKRKTQKKGVPSLCLPGRDVQVRKGKWFSFSFWDSSSLIGTYSQKYLQR